MASVTFKDYYVITSLMTSCRWINIGRQANLIDSVTDEFSFLFSISGSRKIVASFLPYQDFWSYHECWSIYDKNEDIIQ